LESADRAPLLIAKGALNFVIVGAGPAGAEMAGTLGDMTQRMLKDVYKDLNLSKAQLVTRMDISARASIDVSQ
jgi:NADH:ubiquinone reductase (H+-translocating)